MKLNQKVKKKILGAISLALFAYLLIGVYYPLNQLSLKKDYRTFHLLSGSFVITNIYLSRGFTEINLANDKTYLFQSKELEKVRRIEKGDVIKKRSKEGYFTILKKNGKLLNVSYRSDYE